MPNSWNAFQSAHAGQGLSRSDISQAYHASCSSSSSSSSYCVSTDSGPASAPTPAYSAAASPSVRATTAGASAPKAAAASAMDATPTSKAATASTKSTPSKASDWNAYQKARSDAGDYTTPEKVARDFKESKTPFSETTRATMDALHPRTKKGSDEDGTHGAHLLGFDFVAKMSDNRPGPKITKLETKKNIAKVLNDPANVRIKQKSGNVTVKGTGRQETRNDQVLDKKILEKVKSCEPLNGQETNRAVQIVKGAKGAMQATDVEAPVVVHCAKVVGEMMTTSGKTVNKIMASTAGNSAVASNKT